VSNLGGGAITTGVGVFIGSVAGTTNYGIYQTDATADNYFAGNVGIGTTAPGGKFHVEGGDVRIVGPDNSYVEESLLVYGGTIGWQAPYLTLRRARGTQAAATYPTSGDGLGYLSFRNHLGNDGAGISVFATETHSASVGGSEMSLKTVPNGSATSVDRVRITSAGDVGIGTTTPSAALDVNGHIANSAATAPTLSSCGTGAPAITGNDTRGQITMGNSSPTSCTVTFATAFGTAPYCIITPFGADQGSRFWISSTTTTAMVFNVQTGSNGKQFNYFCMQ
ncbi:MAG: hypothetical protein AAB250_14005, partial [Bdellovibrionota bacterium]